MIPRSHARATAGTILWMACTAVGAGQPADWPHLSPQGWGLAVDGGRLNHAPWDYRPREVTGAAAHLQRRFLPQPRSGERIDVWVPQGARQERFPCVVLYYGGGWGGKVAAALHQYARDLVARGYVVAMPDYLLQAESPVPAAIWDGAAAIRYLRAHAAEYRIDPARIGVWGFSAGGWLVQYLCPSDSSTLVSVVRRDPTDRRKKLPPSVVPMLDVHPAHAEQPLRVQGVVSDWGCGKLHDERMHGLNPHWLGPDDPPLLTCHNVPGEIPEGPKLYRRAGAVAEVAQLDVRSTHVPAGDSPAIGKDGRPTTWQDRVYRFFDEYVRHPQRATAPEAVPAGGPINRQTEVTLRCVHPAATIRYTLDGSDPSDDSPAYAGRLTISPGQVLKATAIAFGLQPSAVATFRFPKCTHSRPVITSRQGFYRTRTGDRFEVRLSADQEGVAWHLCGRPGNVIDRRVNPPRLVPWLRIDPRSGTLFGTPDVPGYAVVLVVASIADGPYTLCDARQVVVTVQP